MNASPWDGLTRFSLRAQIDVGFNSIDQAGALRLLAAMKDKDMASIGMHNCNLGVEGAKIVAKMVSAMGSLTSLDLRVNKLGPEGAKALAPGLRNNSSLTSIGEGGLDLRNNLLGDEGWSAIIGAVCGSSVSMISSIDASKEGISIAGAKLIAEALGTCVNSALTILDMRYNRLDAREEALRKAVEGNVGFELLT